MPASLLAQLTGATVMCLVAALADSHGRPADAFFIALIWFGPFSLLGWFCVALPVVHRALERGVVDRLPAMLWRYAVGGAVVGLFACVFLLQAFTVSPMWPGPAELAGAVGLGVLHGLVSAPVFVFLARCGLAQEAEA